MEMDHSLASFPAEFTAMKPMQPLRGKEEKIENEIVNWVPWEEVYKLIFLTPSV